MADRVMAVGRIGPGFSGVQEYALSVQYADKVYTGRSMLSSEERKHWRRGKGQNIDLWALTAISDYLGGYINDTTD